MKKDYYQLIMYEEYKAPLVITPVKNINQEKITDYKEVIEYVKKNITLKYQSINICKVVDAIDINI